MNKLKQLKVNRFVSIIITLIMLISFSMVLGCSKSSLDKVSIYYNEEDQMVFWNIVDGASKYIVNINGDECAVNTSFYILSGDEQTNLAIKVKAVSSSNLVADGEYSHTLYVYIEEEQTFSFVSSKDNFKSAKEWIDGINSKIVKSTVKIINNPYYVREGMFTKENIYTEGKQGSGVIFQKDNKQYFLFTNNHVISIDDKKYTKQDLIIYDYKGNEYTGKLVYNSAEYDLAILSFTTEETFTPLAISTKELNVGDWVASVSTPKGVYNNVSLGEYVGLALVDTSATGNTSKINFDVIKHTCEIDSGSSGSVLVNLDFEICGINFGRGMVGNDTYSFAVTTGKIREFIAEANSAK